MSALPPKADINPHTLECLLCAISGDRLNAATKASLQQCTCASAKILQHWGKWLAIALPGTTKRHNKYRIGT